MDGSILLVDNDPPIVRLLFAAFNASGFKAIVVTSAEFAWSSLRHDRPDAILCEIDLPGMDGVEFSRRMKADDQLGSIPLFLMSATSPPSSHQADGFISKPFDALEVVETVGRYLQPS